MRMPEDGDWLDSYKHGNCGYDNFGGKAYSDSFNTLYIQPITYDQGSHITDSILEKLRKWCEVFYTPCKCEILPRMPASKLENNSTIDKKTNWHGKKQFNAIHILKNVIQPIQRSAKNSIGVLSVTDCDLFTKSLSNYCFGYGIPAYGGV